MRVLMLISIAVDPSNDQQARGDPFKTLFVARLSYDVKESDLEREFGRFGPIERVQLQAVRLWVAHVTDTLSDSHCERHRNAEGREEITQGICFYCV